MTHYYRIIIIYLLLLAVHYFKLNNKNTIISSFIYFCYHSTPPREYILKIFMNFWSVRFRNSWKSWKFPPSNRNLWNVWKMNSEHLTWRDKEQWKETFLQRISVFSKRVKIRSSAIKNWKIYLNEKHLPWALCLQNKYLRSWNIHFRISNMSEMLTFDKTRRIKTLGHGAHVPKIWQIRLIIEWIITINIYILVKKMRKNQICWQKYIKSKEKRSKLSVIK